MRERQFITTFLFYFLVTTSTGIALAQGAPTSTEPNLKVAFFGDQGLGTNPNAVMQLIKNEGSTTSVPVKFLIHVGDLDYQNSPSSWETQVDQQLGADFPYFATVGNHDAAQWGGSSGYQARLQQRLSRISGATCSGTAADLGVNSACSYRGLFFILSGVDTVGSGHSTFIRNSLASSNAIWEVCAWHKNQKTMQIGGKSDEAGWPVYEECRKGGAIIVTGHEHSYERTKTLLNMQLQTLDPNCPNANTECVEAGDVAGRTFAVVSGLGGVGIRNQDLCLPTTPPYGCNGVWAKIYTSDQSATYGVLFITFNVDGNPYLAKGQFKNIRGEIIDSFDIIKSLPGAFNFSLSNSGNKSVSPGASVANQITATLINSTSEAVTFSASGLPSGATPTFLPTSCSPNCTSALTIQTTPASPDGSYPVTVTGTAGSVTRSTQFTLTISTGGTITPLTNPSFENGQTGWLDWGSEEVIDNTTAADGANSFHTFDSASVTRMVYQDVPVEGGKDYVLGYAYKTKNLGTNQAHIHVNWPGTPDTSDVAELHNLSGTIATWQTGQSTVTAPANAQTARIQLILSPVTNGVPANDAEIWYDALSFAPAGSGPEVPKNLRIE